MKYRDIPTRLTYLKVPHAMLNTPKNNNVLNKRKYKRVQRNQIKGKGNYKL